MFPYWIEYKKFDWNIFELDFENKSHE